MIQTLNRFSTESLFDATSHLLHKLHIEFDREIAEPINVADLYDGPMPQYLTDVLACIKNTYFIGIVNDKSLAGAKNADSLEDVAETIQHGGKYDGLFVFACDAKQDANLTRTAAAALTRAFNRLASANPVILIIRQNNLLSISTCERMNYSQEWRQGSGEKLGRVSILRNIDCVKPHRGHVDILESLGDRAYATFEELYKHWMEVFSNELLTKKFYSELSDWYAWAVMVAKFPNDLNTEEDDTKYNHEACIRLITRLIFVWFLKEKHLIPEEFFDEKYIRENLIDNFDPHSKQSLYYNAGKSKYYRLILQNLFFAMLNCPIVAEGKDTPNNRRFRGDSQKGYLRDGYNVNNLMRYKADFKEGGADKFVQIANSHVPFLNGGLFDCLDKKPEKLYYDGFSERKESLNQLYLPDWLFFGEEVGKSIDLSQWYDDNKKQNVSARGLIDILKRYSFTIEENTPLDQEVSLDPELLGKVFENLLAAYNPETKQSARKQTGSFYTPREIVQYMVDESLVAHLKRVCGDELEPEYRKLLSYSTEETSLDKEQRKAIMQAVYNCRVLDPACGSGAFPMGVLQQLVHVLRQLDPTNEMWKEFMIELATEQSKIAFAANEETERKSRLADIEEAFNKSINDPDYARKLYLIEHCIYGVDIQPIAVQISKLRFFISLVVDQKPTNDVTHNFGIRPLPNLESKFVAANTLIPIGYDASLFETTDGILSKKAKLKELNHQIFLAKRNIDKQHLMQKINETRTELVQAIEDTGFVSQGAAQLLANWDMFDQNASSSFFDPEWMFGVKDGFDIVIANPPYMDFREIPSVTANHIREFRCMYNSNRPNFFIFFIEKAISLLKENACLTFINPMSMLSTDSAYGIRKEFLRKGMLKWIVDVSHVRVFEEASTYVIMWNYINAKQDSYKIQVKKGDSLYKFENDSFDIDIDVILADSKLKVPCNKNALLAKKISKNCKELKEIGDLRWGTSMAGYGKKKISSDIYDSLSSKQQSLYKPIVQTADIKRHYIKWQGEYIPKSIYSDKIQGEFSKKKILVGRLTKTMQSSYDDGFYYVGKSTLITNIKKVDIFYLLALLNSKLMNFWYTSNFDSTHMAGGYIRFDVPYLEQLPIKDASETLQKKIHILVEIVIKNKEQDFSAEKEENRIDLIFYKLYNLNYDEVLIIDPEIPITREEYESEM